MARTTTRRSFINRNPWFLPLLLALLILLVVGGAIFGPKIMSAINATDTPTPRSTSTPRPSPSATAKTVVKTVVVTATPGGDTPTPGGNTPTTGGNTPTPNSGPAASGPVPSPT